jgi:hypothetical protein
MGIKILWFTVLDFSFAQIQQQKITHYKSSNNNYMIY